MCVCPSHSSVIRTSDYPSGEEEKKEKQIDSLFWYFFPTPLPSSVIPADCGVCFPGQESAAPSELDKAAELEDVASILILQGGRATKNDPSINVNHIIFQVLLWHTNKNGPSPSFPLLNTNNSPLFIRPITVNSKYCLSSTGEYRPNTVAVLFGCSLNAESKNTSFSIGSPSACCRKLVTSLLLAYERRSITEK